MTGIGGLNEKGMLWHADGSFAEKKMLCAINMSLCCRGAEARPEPTATSASRGSR